MLLHLLHAPGKCQNSVNFTSKYYIIVKNYFTKLGMSLTGRNKTSILDKPLSRGKGEVSLSCFALLFSEVVQYCQNKSQTVPELQNRLHELGRKVGVKLIDLYFLRERNGKREIKLLNILLFVKSTLWKALFGREADKLEHSNDDENTYYLMEKEPLVNRFISVPRDKSSLNCAVFIAGIVEAVLTGTGFFMYGGVNIILENMETFNYLKTSLESYVFADLETNDNDFTQLGKTAKVTAHWHKGTTYMVKFDDAVVSRDKQLEER